MAKKKQFVNLKTTGVHPDDVATAGRTFKVTAKPNKPPKKGKVQWRIQPGDDNVDEKYLAAAERAKLKDEESSLVGGDRFETELTLPHVGLDTVTVQVMKKKFFSGWKKFQEQEFETWRRVYYTIHTTNDDCLNEFLGMKADFEAAFTPAGIELKELEDKRVRTNIDPAVAECGDTANDYDLKYLYTGNTPPALIYKPYNLKVVVVNDVADVGEKQIQSSVNSSCVANPAWTPDPDRWVEDLDKGSRPASKGDVKVAAFDNPSKLTSGQVTSLSSFRTGDRVTVSDSGTLTKGNCAASANQELVWDGKGWVVKNATQATVADINSATPSRGDVRELTDSGTLTAGSRAVSSGDIVIYGGSGKQRWCTLRANKGTFRVADVNKPRARPAGLSDDQIDSLITPSDGDAWKVTDAGKIGALDVKAGQLVKREGGNWAIHRGRWVMYYKHKKRFSQQNDWLDPGDVLMWAAGDGSSTRVEGLVDRVTKNDGSVDMHQFKIRVHDNAGLNDSMDRGLDVFIRFDLNMLDGGCCGYAFGNVCVVRIKEAKDGRPESALQTMTHEIAHSLQQTQRRFATHDANGSATGNEDNAKWYDDDYGGQGDHCSHNAKTDSGYTTASGKIYIHDSGKLCTMFDRDHAEVEPKGKFCDVCTQSLRRTNFGEAPMKANRWELY